MIGITIECPHCGFSSFYTLEEITKYGGSVLHKDGCGMFFEVKIELAAKVSTEKLNFQGKEK